VIAKGRVILLYLRLDLIKQIVYSIHVDMFIALADPTRRNILELLANSGELPATAIYQHFPISPPAVSQHLKVLREAHLVEMEKRAQQHVYRLNPETLSEFEAWVKHMQQRWEERFAALDIVLEREKKKLVQDEQESRKYNEHI
jgi:DNA-binding transcriptional ArsR family regulator